MPNFIKNKTLCLEEVPTWHPVTLAILYNDSKIGDI